MFYGLVNMCLLFIAFLLSVLCFSFYSTFAPRGCGGVEYFRVSPSALLEEVPTTIYPFFEGFFSFFFEFAIFGMCAPLIGYYFILAHLLLYMSTQMGRIYPFLIAFS